MFKFMHGGTAWKVEFSHQKFDPPHNLCVGSGKQYLIHGTTTCTISKQDGEITERYASRDSWCLVGDQWKRAAGREKALARTLQDRGLVKIDNPPPEHPQLEAAWRPYFTRDFRRLVWACYWVMSNRRDRVMREEANRAIIALQAAGKWIGIDPGHEEKIPPCQTDTGDEPKEQNVQG